MFGTLVRFRVKAIKCEVLILDLAPLLLRQRRVRLLALILLGRLGRTITALLPLNEPLDGPISVLGVVTKPAL
jgi:hypothetical protein